MVAVTASSAETNGASPARRHSTGTIPNSTGTTKQFDKFSEEGASPSRCDSPFKSLAASSGTSTSGADTPSSKGTTPSRKKSGIASFFSTDASEHLYLTDNELEEMSARHALRDASVKYCVNSIYYGVPVKVKGVIAGASSPTKGGNVGKEFSTADDPDMVFITIDIPEIIRRRTESNGNSSDVVVYDPNKENFDYPESVAVDKSGDVLVSYRGIKKQRKIKGKALQDIIAKPGQPRPPYIVGRNKNDLTISWECNDEGTGLIDEYQLEYKEMFKHDAGWKALANKKWMPPDDLLHLFDGLPPCTSYIFRVKSMNRIGWGEFSEASEIGTTEASEPSTPNKVFASKVTPECVMLHWDRPNDNGSRIIEYILRGKRVGSVFKDFYKGPANQFVTSSLEPGNDFLFEVRALNSYGKSGWSLNFIVHVPLIVDPNAMIDVSAELRKGFLWLECFDSKEEREFWFHTITGDRQLIPPPEWIQYKEEQKQERLRNAKLRGDKPGEGKEGDEPDRDPIVAFRLKRFKFFRDLKKHNGHKDDPKVLHHPLTITRANLFTDTLKIFSKITKGQLCKKFKIIFEGEEGIDSGGLTKDWYLLLSRSLSVEKNMIFKSVKSAGGHLEINQSAPTSPSQLQKFKFAGMVLGKALYDRQFLDMPFTKTLYKLILGIDVGIDDLEEIDPVLFKSLVWMMDNEITNVLFETFSVEVKSEDGKMEQVALCENGENRDVDEGNKAEYVEKMGEWRLKFSVMEFFDAFMAGLNTLVPNELLREFTITELELLFNGKTNIDVDEIRAYTIFQGSFNGGSKEVLWFWQILRELEPESKQKLLRFVTGSDRVPLDGFDPPFNVTEGSDMTPDMLPRAHTCFNQIVLPRYPSLEAMKKKVVLAMENTEGFELS
jgi:hypothetical protein